MTFGKSRSTESQVFVICSIDILSLYFVKELNSLHGYCRTKEDKDKAFSLKGMNGLLFEGIIG